MLYMVGDDQQCISTLNILAHPEMGMCSMAALLQETWAASNVWMHGAGVAAADNYACSM